MNPRLIAIAAVLAALPLASEAETYRCRPVELLNAQGLVVKRIDPEGAEKERLAKEASEARKRQEESAARETARRNQALLATYTSEKDIDDARARALAENTKATQKVEERIAMLRQQQAGYQKEIEQYKGKAEPASGLQHDLKTTEADIKAQEELLDVKKRELEAINARYDDDKKRYSALSQPR
jgi:chromosome segregation ATPase